MTTIAPKPFWPFFVACLLLFGLTNFASWPLLLWVPSVGIAWFALAFACQGAIGAQMALHAVWCVLAPVGFRKRLAIGVAAGLLLFGAWSLGSAVFTFHMPILHWEPLLTVLLCLPLLAIGAQTPLWLARFWCGWRILHEGDPFRRPGGEAFGIRDIFAATAALALALSAGQLAMLLDTVPGAGLSRLAINALWLAGISLCITLPAVAATLHARRVWLAVSATLTFDVVLGVGYITLTTSVIPGGVPSHEVYVVEASMVAAFFLSLTGVLLGVRSRGYRLLWNRRRRAHGLRDEPPLASRERADSQTDGVFEP